MQNSNEINSIDKFFLKSFSFTNTHTLSHIVMSYDTGKNLDWSSKLKRNSTERNRIEKPTIINSCKSIIYSRNHLQKPQGNIN